ncbi:MAG: hypothetical protein IPO65_07020 [Saprospiraceae bacterium]|nr:hypothetical protein [Saprospiraceae bacterium]
MKNNLLIIIFLLLSATTYSQNQDSINAIIDEAIKAFSWEIETSDKRTLMLTEVSFRRDNQDKDEYLSITVGKNKAEKRPEFISVIIPNNIVRSNGIFITFATTEISEAGEIQMELQKDNPKRINFATCNDEVCIARIYDGYVTDEKTNEKTDIFQKFLDFDRVLFLFIYPDKSHKSVYVPLGMFKDQYMSLP